MAIQPHVNKFNYLLNDVTINEDTMRTAGIRINTNPGGKIDLSQYNIIGFVSSSTTAQLIGNIELKSGVVISNFNLKSDVYYPISIKSFTSSSTVDIVVFYREP